MPLLDMPLEQLRQYTGSSPCPADMEAYWARALRELEATDPAPTCVPAHFQVPGYQCSHLYFNGVGGGRIHCKLVQPLRLREKAPALLQFHGYGGDGGAWTDKLAWAAMGFVVCAMDVRGQGGLSQDHVVTDGPTQSGHIIRGLSDGDPAHLFYRQVFLDTAMAARVVMALENVDADNVSAMGGSQGGALAIACAALVPSLRRAAVCFPFLCDYQRVWEMDMAERAYGELKDYFRKFDPTHSREKEIFTRLGYIDLQNLAGRIRAQVQMHTGLMDNVCPPSTQFAMYNKIVSPKEVVVYPDYGHEELKGAADRMAQFLLYGLADAEQK